MFVLLNGFFENKMVMAVLCSWPDPQEILLAVWLA